MFDLKIGDPVPLGIYFGLPEDIYHADPEALGSSPIKEIHVNPADHQYNNIMGQEHVKEFDLGSALHARILEGEDALNARFAPMFDPSEYPGALDTNADLIKFLKEHDQKGMSGKKKADLIEWVLEVDMDAEVLELRKKDYLSANEGKTFVSVKDWALVENAAQMLQKDHDLGPVMENGAFIKGAPEVSFFYMDGDIKRKLRVDRLLRHALVDLKSFSPKSTGNMQRLVLAAIRTNYYEIQSADYLRSFGIVKELFRDGDIEVFGEPPYDTFLEECFASDEDPDWVWVFVKTKGCPQPQLVNWKGKQRIDDHKQKVVEALETYRFFVGEYGKDDIWHPQHPAIDLDDEDYRGGAS
ncbi:exonuclease VIII [Pseudovibrio axinellae]|uniref:Exonuclease VIII n=1 Tax=Pseudovibrio axinellae TaxID=989403 RepID=A0A165XES0_9HYPH|nr:hypothetical protein [Pseudovibrio axinellae]KZL17638.1 exonuclease VIII [Pseudovibrio axinellae]SER45392.1 hypothetical protein SAMN05421798_110108 [Pseudovibrio axinellae]